MSTRALFSQSMMKNYMIGIIGVPAQGSVMSPEQSLGEEMSFSVCLLCPIAPLIHSRLFCRGWKVGLSDRGSNPIIDAGFFQTMHHFFVTNFHIRKSIVMLSVSSLFLINFIFFQSLFIL